MPGGWDSAVPLSAEIFTAFIPLFHKLDRIEKAVVQGLWKRRSDPPSAASVTVARAILDRLQANGFCPSGVTPSAEGGVGIYFDRALRYADIEVLNSGKVLGVVSNKSGSVTAFEVHPSREGHDKAINLIRAFLAS